MCFNIAFFSESSVLFHSGATLTWEKHSKAIIWLPLWTCLWSFSGTTFEYYSFLIIIIVVGPDPPHFEWLRFVLPTCVSLKRRTHVVFGLFVVVTFFLLTFVGRLRTLSPASVRYLSEMQVFGI